MKKIYSLSLAVAVALGASAAGRSTAVSSLNIQTPSNIAVEKTSLMLAPKSGVAAKAANTGFESVKDMEGAWELSMYWLLTDQNGEGAGMATAELQLTVVNEATGEVALTGFPQNFAVKASVNLDLGTFTIPNNQSLGADSYGDANYFYFKDIDDEGYTIDGASSIIASVGDIADGGIVFPQFELWTIGDPDAEHLGFWWLSGLNEMAVAAAPVDPDLGWVDFTTGTFADGWVISAYGLNPADYPYQVKIQQNETEPTLYRIANPYISDTFPGSTDGNEAGGIVFDLTSPEFVPVLPYVFSGMMNGTAPLYFYNVEGYYMANGFSEEEIIAGLGDQISFSSYNTEDKKATFLNCRFCINSACDKLYSWVDENNNSLADLMHGWLVFDKQPVATVENVAVEENNAAVEYFNLQGMRVANPSRGEIVIKRQGSVASKVRF